MYRPFVFIILLIWSISVLLMPGCSSNNAPKVVFSNKTYQFSEPFIVGSEIDTTFSFTNEGNAPLHIQKIDTDCGCVATNTSADKIAPGSKGEIRVAVKRGVGEFHQNVFVSTNDPVTPMVRLEVLGVIIPPVAYPNKINLRQLEKGKRVSQKLTFTNNLKDTVEIIGHTVSNKNIAATLPKKSIPAGESIECDAVFTLSDVGLFSESLTITVEAQEVLPGTDSKELEMSILFHGRVLGGIVVLPQHLFLGVLDGSGKTVQKQVQIKTDGSQSFALKEITADNFSVTASLATEPQTAHEIELSITPKMDSKTSGLVEGTIQISTTHPDVPEITIPIKAVTL